MATIEGMVLYPSREGITKGLPSFTAAAAELVVPRSIPMIAPWTGAFWGAIWGASAGGVGAAGLGGCPITGGGAFGSGGREDAFGGARGTGDGGGMIPFSELMSTFGWLGAGGGGGPAGAAAGARAASTLRGGGGVPPRPRITARATSSTPSSCSRMPASLTSQTTAAARKQGSPEDKRVSSRTKVSTAW